MPCVCHMKDHTLSGICLVDCCCSVQLSPLTTAL
jgi:hypothetical protein